jgi:enterochelin esterase-like enzyme
MKQYVIMNAVLVIGLSLSMLFSSCEKKRDLPDNPNAPFPRYETDLTMHSKILGTTLLYSVYLPADYVENPDRHYPVVYLLHGLGDDHKSWNDQWLNICALIEQLETQEGLAPMIYVMPQGFRTYYVNRYNGSYDYMDMFTRELVSYVDRTYRTLPDKHQRALVGYSMGGFGAMILSSKNPELFMVSAPLSMSVRTDQQYMTEPESGWNNQWGAIFGGVGTSGAGRLTDYYKEHCPFYMFNAQSANRYAGIKYFIDCGDDEEQLLVANDDLHVLLRESGISHEYRVRNGAHQSSYWRSGMPEVLRFIVACFHGEPYGAEESVTLPGSFSAVKETTTLASVPVEVYLPRNYTAETDKQYPVLYLCYEEDGKLHPDNIMKILDNTQTSKPFIMITCTAQAMESASSGFHVLSAAAANRYRIKTGAAYATGIGYGVGGKWLYDATQIETPAISSLFFVDASLNDDLSTPNSQAFHYITITDEGVNYKTANMLYKKCHAGGIPYEYRVYNGAATINSVNVLFDNLKGALYDKIKTK